jgi:hypothetical protein
MKPIAKRPTKAAISVLRQATALRPNRKKASDGLLPSAAHIKQNPNSDHNTGFAVDLTHDPAFGINGHEVYEHLKSDKRVKYLIFKGQIWSPEKGDHKYTGPNQHNHHIHISIKDECGNDNSPWFAWMGKAKTINKVKANFPKPLPKKETK